MLGWLTLATVILFNVLGNYFIKRFSISADLNNPLDYFRPLFMSGVFSSRPACCFTRARLRRCPSRLLILANEVEEPC